MSGLKALRRSLGQLVIANESAQGLLERKAPAPPARA
jgi:hypothetical protein